MSNNEIDSAMTTSSSNAERHFDVIEGLVVDVRSASGDLRVRESDTATCRVRLTTSDKESARRLAAVECVYDPSNNRLSIDTRAAHGLGGGSLGFKKALSMFVDSVRHDVDVEVDVPAGSSIRYRTASGDLHAEVTVSGLDVTSASGDVSATDVQGAITFNSASGDIDVQRARSTVETKLASGDVRIGAVEGDLKVQSVSGDVVLTFAAAVDAKVSTVSGDVSVGVHQGILLELDANTVSGDLMSEIALDGSNAVATAERMLQLKARTVSGNVKVRRA